MNLSGDKDYENNKREKKLTGVENSQVTSLNVVVIHEIFPRNTKKAFVIALY
jgi:hypothetical protein